MHQRALEQTGAELNEEEGRMDAPERATEIKAAIAAVIGFLTALWGWLGWTVLLWICAILLDYVSGSLAAKREKNWSSEIARDGLWHKTGEIFSVLVAALCDIALQVVAEGSGIQIPFEIGPLLTPIVLLWYILTEAGSIIENCGRLGARVPKWFRQKIKEAADAIDHDQEKPTYGPVSDPDTGPEPTIEEILEEYKKK